MLAHALKIVEAARALKIERSALIPGAWKMTCHARHVNEKFGDLGLAIEAFDREVGSQSNPIRLLSQVFKLAAEHGIDLVPLLHGFSLDDFDFDGDPREENEDLTLRPTPGVIGRPDDLQDMSLSRRASAEAKFGLDRKLDVAAKYKPGTHVVEERPVGTGPRSAVQSALTSRSEVTHHSLSPSVPIQKVVFSSVLEEGIDEAMAHDGDFSKDAIEEFEAIEAKLEALVGKIGWTPKMKQLMAAWLHVRQRMEVKDSPNGPICRMPVGAVIAIVNVARDLDEIERDPSIALDHEAERLRYIPR